MRPTFATFLVLVVLASQAGRADEGTKAEKGAAALSLLKTLDEGFVQVFEKVAPSVVVIEATKRADAEDGEGPKGLEFFFDERKDTTKPPNQGEGGQSWTLPAPPRRSEGSGFIIRADGVILTNHHVVADAEKIRVRLKDGRAFTAKMVGADDKTDIAVLRIEAKDLPTVEMGDSAALRVGQLVCAIGTPFNQDYSFTVGWVSGKGRTNLLGPTSTTILYEDYIQTDAFINPGNSGGPLFDVEGKIVGMNTLINGVGRGLAFAIPAAMLADVSAQLLANGKVQRAWLGIRIETLDEGSRPRERPPGVEKAVIVETIEANAPASKSDLRPADVITEVDGMPVGTARELQREILKAKIGQPVQLTVWRGGSARKIAVPTAELPATITKLASPPAKKPGDVRAAVFGLKLHDAQPAGAQIAEIAPGSAASKSELLVGDVITEVATKPVGDAAECGAAIAAAAEGKGGKNVALNIERHGKRSYVVLNPKK
ncbi:MAG: trypsin-like peptidase domain-containing protein [Chthoniobacter sp.]|nr:trypsin-like peptidase domain-containing protein [Chthoniobacter sp.]